MFKVVSPKTMYAIDQMNLKKKSMTSYELMFQAAKACYDNMNKDLIFRNAKEIIIIYGKGHNGGDALLIGYELIKRTSKVTLFTPYQQNELNEDTLIALNKLKTLSNFEETLKINKHFDIIIDGLFGIGYQGKLEEHVERLITKVNESRVPVFSIDIPSGLNANTGIIDQSSMIAYQTYVIQYLKYGNILNQAKDVHGDIKIVDAGIDSYSIHIDAYKLSGHFFKETLAKRKHYTHKYHYGKVLIYAYKATMPGALNLATKAALRSGIGLVSYVSDNRYALMNLNDEVIQILSQNDMDLKRSLDRVDAVLFGPGLGREKHHQTSLIELLNKGIPLVIDGDGIAHLKGCIDFLPKTLPIVITPHQGEWSNFFNQSNINQIELLEKLHIFNEYDICWVLKGPATLIHYKKETYIMDIAPSALAKAGSGDVLSGIITSLLGQGFSPLKAGLYGVYIHSLAALKALEKETEETFIPSDMIQEFPQVFRILNKD